MAATSEINFYAFRDFSSLDTFQCSTESVDCSLTPAEIREKLVELGVLPSRERAREVFFELGEEWWRCVIDGWAHKLGPLVFDKGLHLGSAEPGYLEGIRKGCQVFVDQMDCDLSVDLYQRIH